MLTSDQLQQKYFPSSGHPYRKYESKVDSLLPCNTILDVGCGRTASVLRKYIGKATVLIGVDLEDRVEPLTRITYIKGDISSIPVPRETADLIISRSVLEHLPDPNPVFREIARVLKPNGSWVFLVPNAWDYVSVISRLIPNRWHGWIVKRTEGRSEADTFPTYYRANSYFAIKKLSEHNGLEIVDFQWLGQYPSVFWFNPYLFLIATSYHKLIEKYRCLRFLRGWLLVHLIKGGE